MKNEFKRTIHNIFFVLNIFYAEWLSVMKLKQGNKKMI